MPTGTACSQRCCLEPKTTAVEGPSGRARGEGAQVWEQNQPGDSRAHTAQGEYFSTEPRVGPTV